MVVGLRDISVPVRPCVCVCACVFFQCVYVFVFSVCMCLHMCAGVALTAESQEAGVGDRCLTQVQHLEAGQVF